MVPGTAAAARGPRSEEPITVPMPQPSAAAVFLMPTRASWSGQIAGKGRAGLNIRPQTFFTVGHSFFSNISCRLGLYCPTIQ